MVELVRTGVVEVLTLDIQLNAVAQALGQTVQMGNRCRSALKVLADAAQLGDKFCRLADGLVGIADFDHRCFKLLRDVSSAVFSKIAVVGWVVFKVGIKINVV